jgi:precorrin-3B synthase
VRNILGSPLSGRRAGSVDVGPLVRGLDVAICADPGLAGLPGRFLFAVDDGTGDVAGLDADIAWQAGSKRLLLGRAAFRVPAGDALAAGGAVAAMIAAARAFLAAGGGTDGVWRLRDLPGGAGRIATELGLKPVPAEAHDGQPPAIGLETVAGSTWAVLAVPLGRLAAAQARMLADTATGGLAVSPWRQIVIDLPTDRAADELAGLVVGGLVADPSSPWIGITACAGTGGCASALADVRADAGTLANGPAGGAVHFAGCDRRCGQPAGPVLVAVATGDGYRIGPPSEQPVSALDLAAGWRRSAR